MPVAYRVGVALLGASIIAGCASQKSMNQSGAPQPSTAGSAAVMPTPGAGGTPASQGGVKGAMAATTGAVGGVATAVKSGAGKMVSWVTPDSKPTPAPDATSLASGNGKPSVDLHVAMADMQEKSGNVEQAKQHYESALKQNPKNANALLGMAHLLDRQGKLKEAGEKYQLAAKYHPKDARVWNDLGLCYARQKKLKESVAALNKAIELEPQKQLFRNNIATVLTEMGRTDEALTHLTAAHGAAVAHYNLGYLLHQKGNKEGAAKHFAQAATVDPNFAAARDWANQLGANQLAAEGAAPPQVQVASREQGEVRQSAIASQRTPAGAGSSSEGYEPYYRNQLRQQPGEPATVAGAGYNAGYNGAATPDFTESRIATSPRPLPAVDSNEGPPIQR
ncbi:MAG: tetratricopeptide repeat protein [Planctomycetes bacterium]|nr:tetratricopeptide repeat protein [Planctomycetota bacterium]